MDRSKFARWMAAGLVVSSALIMLSRWAWPVTWAPLGPRCLTSEHAELALFLMLLPVAALAVCVARNVIGLNTFGTFTPALLGLALREVGFGFGVVLLAFVLVPGWWFRQFVERLNLLPVPRSALMLTLLCVVMLFGLIGADATGLQAGRFVTLLPLVILTGMLERFWTSLEEESSGNAVSTLTSTLACAGVVALLTGIPALSRWMMNHPETLGMVMAGQILIGRYTGYRLNELYRYRELSHHLESTDATLVVREPGSETSRRDRSEWPKLPLPGRTQSSTTTSGRR